jgi:protein SCO1/2
MRRRDVIGLVGMAILEPCVPHAQTALPGPVAPSSAGGPFVLVAADGRTVTDQSFRGRWLVVYFGYTFCPAARTSI